MELTEESLMRSMRQVQLLYQLKEEPKVMFVGTYFHWVADRMLNPWKAKRAMWLRGKRCR
jgi:hypothetical protein